MNRVIVLIFCVCFTNGKDMALQRQIWSTFVTVLWVRKTEIQDRAGILVLVRVLWVRIPKIYWQFWQSFFKYSFKSSSNFYPIGITWRKMARAVCLQPVSRKPWRLHTLWRFTVPAYRKWPSVIDITNGVSLNEPNSFHRGVEWVKPGLYLGPSVFFCRKAEIFSPSD